MEVLGSVLKVIQLIMSRSGNSDPGILAPTRILLLKFFHEILVVTENSMFSFIIMRIAASFTYVNM